MRTILIATKEHLENINKYKLFYEPFITDDVSFCEWVTGEELFEKMVPDIYKCINGALVWRAIILYDPTEENSTKMNPFDVVNFKDYSRKEEAYYDAAKQPLVRLTTFLCPHPLDLKTDKVDEKAFSNGDDCNASRKKIEENERDNYFRLASIKGDIRSEILGDEKLKAEMPRDVICISLRTIKNETEDDKERVSIAWKKSSDMAYQEFNDSNLYLDRLRFLAYDILPSDHINYKFDYLKFIYTILIFAANPLPDRTMQSSRLYCLRSSCSENKLRQLIINYNLKLTNTIQSIDKKIENIKNDFPEKMNDGEATALFQSRERIDVKISKDVDLTGLLPKRDEIGLSNRCPQEESVYWEKQYAESTKAMHKLVKQPRRSLERSANHLREVNKNNDLRYLALNHFQLDDIKEFADNEEEKMATLDTKDFYNLDRYDKRTKEASNKVYKVIRTRMTRTTTLKFGLVFLVAFLIGILPILFYNDDLLTSPIPLIIDVLMLVILAIVMIVELFFLRKELTSKIDDYNDNMHMINSEVKTSMNLFSEYLSSMCGVMRSYYVLNAARDEDNAFKRRIRLLRNNIEKISDKQGEVYELFGEYCFENVQDDTIEPYEYDFEQIKDYSYPIPFKQAEFSIPFVEDCYKVVVPLDLVDSISISMEELYD